MEERLEYVFYKEYEETDFQNFTSLKSLHRKILPRRATIGSIIWNEEKTWDAKDQTNLKNEMNYV